MELSKSVKILLIIGAIIAVVGIVYIFVIPEGGEESATERGVGPAATATE